jgi:hypothetical protein
LARPAVRVVGPSNILVGDFSRYPGYCQDPKVYAPHGMPTPLTHRPMSPIKSPISGLVAQRMKASVDSEVKGPVYSSFSNHWFEDENVPFEFARRFSSMTAPCMSVGTVVSNLWFDAPCHAIEAQVCAKKETPRTPWWRRGFSLMGRVAGNAVGAVQPMWKMIQDSFQKLKAILVGF